MKLGPLKSAIRDLEQAPKVQIRFHNNTILNLQLQKTPLLAELDRTHPEGRAQETGLAINAEGFLTRDG